MINPMDLLNQLCLIAFLKNGDKVIKFAFLELNMLFSFYLLNLTKNLHLH